MLTELAEVCNYVKFSYFNSNFTDITDSFEKRLEGHYLGYDKRTIYTWFRNAIISFWLRFFNIKGAIFQNKYWYKRSFIFWNIPYMIQIKKSKAVLLWSILTAWNQEHQMLFCHIANLKYTFANMSSYEQKQNCPCFQYLIISFNYFTVWISSVTWFPRDVVGILIIVTMRWFANFLLVYFSHTPQNL